MSDSVSWDAGLIRRYDKAGSRYTAYPSPAHYAEGVLPADLITALQESRTAGRPLSLYVHIPFCANICYYCACTKIITKDRSRAQPYLQSLEREIRLTSRHLSPGQRVERLHVGGGTPTFLGHDDLRRLMERLRNAFTLHEDDTADYSIEIDPREADWATIGLLRELGFNRISFGVQDLDPDVQRAINRLQSPEQTQAVVDAARALAFRSVNIDLIYGLPGQTPDSFARTVTKVIEMHPDRLTLYNYAHLPDLFLPQRKISLAELPDSDSRLEICRRSFAQLLAAGYRHIGMGQFALPDDSLSNAQEIGRLARGLQGYMSGEQGDLIGLGVSAISQVGDLHCRNTGDIKLYQESLGQHRLALHRGLKCSADDRLRRVVINRLLCTYQLRYADIEQRFGIDFATYFADCQGMLGQLHRDGVIRLDVTGIEVLPAGRPLIASVCMVFDAYQHVTDRSRYAQII
ncbi:oxygen-independent coproporphyrinogen III oxidase [Halopseudomonas sp. SMJS2]|uniref:oxygen-independent coproporphyrinogen III oxidase n=1 Tax=Halopseudomonas sp. SMJS2 TaxID=3041098 RepID=UPI0024536945|nr:oxygen-independent coproporphyrinogen III oxidase [Halopseudomonas sp. SMJS2]WGK60572.1 oxygen-independent coproporphyrinogen III oxidase [Halopseudomonas sp. SMJS2]